MLAMMLRLACAMMCASVLAACSGTPRPIPTGRDAFFYGNILSGGKFTVAVGESKRDATQTLTSSGYRYDGESGCDFTLRYLFACKANEMYQSYRVNEWFRDGDIYLKIEDGKVTAVGWSFNLLPYIDS